MCVRVQTSPTRLQLLSDGYNVDDDGDDDHDDDDDETIVFHLKRNFQRNKKKDEK